MAVKEEIVVKVSLPHPKSTSQRYFVRDRNMTFTYRGHVPLSVRRAVERSPTNEVYYRVRDLGSEGVAFLSRLEDLGW